ncbi:MAG: hypothetical protein Q7W13_13775 [Bacteroidia bacterium]|nr:hypothetical protein [Bacteroidia bacterium]
MKSISLVIALLFITVLLNGQGVVCFIKSDKATYKKGELPIIKVEIKNNTDSTIQLVKTLDYSAFKVRFPPAYFKIEKIADTSYKIITYERECGNYDGIDSADFVEVKKGETFDPFSNQTPVYSDFKMKDKRNFAKKGKYKINFYYSTNETNFKKWMGDAYAGQVRNWIDRKTGEAVPEREIEYSKLLKLFSKVPKLDIVSNEIVIEIK